MTMARRDGKSSRRNCANWRRGLKLAEGELRGNIDLSQFGKPDLLSDA